MYDDINLIFTHASEKIKKILQDQIDKTISDCCYDFVRINISDNQKV